MISFREKYFLIAALLLVVYLLIQLYELNVLCIAIILMLFCIFSFIAGFLA